MKEDRRKYRIVILAFCSLLVFHTINSYASELYLRESYNGESIPFTGSSQSYTHTSETPANIITLHNNIPSNVNFNAYDTTNANIDTTPDIPDITTDTTPDVTYITHDDIRNPLDPSDPLYNSYTHTYENRD